MIYDQFLSDSIQHTSAKMVDWAYVCIPDKSFKLTMKHQV